VPREDVEIEALRASVDKLSALVVAVVADEVAVSAVLVD
jgi:hypothetical protein